MRRLVDMNLAYIEHYEASNLNELSAKSYLKSDADVEQCDLILPIGLGSFIEQIVQRNHLLIQLNTIVTNINIPTDKNDPIHISTQDNRHYLSKYVLITISFGFFHCHPHDHMLTLFVCGKISTELEQQTDEEIIEQIFQCLKRIYSQIPKPTKWLVT
ncbi:unnamed protein product [Rotaria sp. Silwood1]|nr:unnamed protein product [Rotaria sp. Silwood1]